MYNQSLTSTEISKKQQKTDFLGRFFQEMEQIKKGLTYLHGLLGNAIHNNVEQMALGQKEKVRSLQYFVGQSQWETAPVFAIHQGLVGKTLGKRTGWH